MTTPAHPPRRTPFPKLYWLVVLFELFERGSYYGVMSVLSVYLTDVLGFAKRDVGVIKGTIQPLLYFLPIVAGALADRFGFRRALFVAFSLLGTGYFLTSQATGYAAVFLSLVVMGIGAGTFKPVISGTIARSTDESNSTLGFGIFYWSINLGAFLWPLVLVPLLKSQIGWDWVLKAAAIGTGAMLLPTLLFYRDPPAADPTDRATAAKPPPAPDARQRVRDHLQPLHPAAGARTPLGLRACPARGAAPLAARRRRAAIRRAPRRDDRARRAGLSTPERRARGEHRATPGQGPALHARPTEGVAPRHAHASRA